MGRGDKRTAKGKRFKKSYGNSRPHKVKVSVAATEASKKSKASKKEKETKAEKPASKKAPAKKAAKKKAE